MISEPNQEATLWFFAFIPSCQEGDRRRMEHVDIQRGGPAVVVEDLMVGTIARIAGALAQQRGRIHFAAVVEERVIPS